MTEPNPGIRCAEWWNKPWWREVENGMRGERAECILGVLLDEHPGLRQVLHDAGATLMPPDAITEPQWRMILRHAMIRATDKEVEEVLRHLGFRVRPGFGAGPVLP